MSGSIMAWMAVVSVALGGGSGWRGDGSGCYPEAEPPLTWSTDQNVLWKTKLPSWSNASPVLDGDRLFICSEPDVLMCLSSVDGSVLWQRSHAFTDVVAPDEVEAYREGATEYARLTRELTPLERELKAAAKKLKQEGDDEPLKARIAELKTKVKSLKELRAPKERYSLPPTHGVNGYTSPTPVSDGKHVYVLFGHGVAACYDYEGQRKWARVVGRSQNGWGHSASPRLAGNRLIVHIAKTITALDTATGLPMWATTGKSVWGTPALVTLDDGHELVVTTGSDLVRVTDGHMLGSGVGRMPYASPLTVGRRVYVVDQAGAQATVLPASMSDSLKPSVLWKAKPRKDRYYASTILADGTLYAITQRGYLSAMDAETGELYYEQKLDLKGTVYPSLTLAGDKLFASGEKGRTVVFAPGREFRQLALNSLEPFRASPVFHGRRLYVRGRSHLWCLEH